MTRRKNIRITEKFDCGVVPARKTGPAIKKFRKTALAAEKRKLKKAQELEAALAEREYERALAAEAGEWDFSHRAVEEMIAQGAEEPPRIPGFSDAYRQMQEKEQAEWHQRMQEIDRRKAREEYEKLAMKAALTPTGARPPGTMSSGPQIRWLPEEEGAGDFRSPSEKARDQAILDQAISPIPEPPQEVFDASLGRALELPGRVRTSALKEFMAPVPTRSSEKRRREAEEEMYRVSPLNYIPKKQRDRMKGIPDSGGFTQNVPLWEIQEQANFQSPHTRPIYREILQHTDARLYVEQALYNKAGVMINWEEGLACGSFGCAFETDEVDKTVKITTDVNEGPGGMAILASKRWWPGLIGVHHVFKWPGTKKIWFLVMERVGTKYDDISFVQDPNTMHDLAPNFRRKLGYGYHHHGDSLTFGNLMNLDYSLDGDIRQHLQQPAVALVFRGRYSSGWPHDYNAFWEMWMEKFMTIFVPKFPQLKDMGDTYQEFWERYHIVFPDIHTGNLACRIYEDPESGLGATCTPWTVRGINDIPYGPKYTLMGPQLLCLDLGVSGGEGLKKMKKKRIAYLNPMLAGYHDLIPEL